MEAAAGNYLLSLAESDIISHVSSIAFFMNFSRFYYFSVSLEGGAE